MRAAAFQIETRDPRLALAKWNRLPLGILRSRQTPLELCQSLHISINHSPPDKNEPANILSPSPQPNKPTTPISNKPSPELRALLRALKRPNPDALLKNVTKLPTVEWQTMPYAVFLEVLRTLHPKYFINPYREIDQTVSPGMIPKVYSKGHIELGKRFKHYLALIKHVVAAYRTAPDRRGNHKSNRLASGIISYNLTLGAIRTTGDGEGAIAFHNLMRKAGTKLDTKSYNFLLEALGMTGVYTTAQRHKVRAIPYNKEAKSKELGVRNQSLKYFGQMIADGIAPDARTYELVMLCLARTGDITAVKDILKRVWNIDVDAVIENDESSLNPVKKYPNGDPLNPTRKLPWIIAEIFGSNNDIPTALRLIDYICRQFELPIQRKAFARLLEWTFVLSRYRSPKRREDGAAAGQLPGGAVESLWNAMVSEPYNLKPNNPMYNMLIKSLSDRDMAQKMVEKMREGKAEHDRILATLKDFKRQIRSWQEVPSVRILMAKQGKPLGVLKRRAQIASMECRRDTLLIRRWVHLLLGSHNWPKGNGDHNVEWRVLPAALEEFEEFLPNHVSYKVSGGRVVIKIRERWKEPADQAEQEKEVPRDNQVQNLKTNKPLAVKAEPQKELHNGRGLSDSDIEVVDDSTDSLEKTFEGMWHEIRKTDMNMIPKRARKKRST
ncbi:MAG: hypothetical protein M1834_004828 [Cirrosporium novae-zelandiae]|nr:MAG: hypothetical protein M1834_004828 [Cirrosporium novae-zelandiae]